MGTRVLTIRREPSSLIYEGTRERTQGAERTFVVVLKLAGGDYPNREHLAVARLGEAMSAMTAGAQQIVKGDEDGDNQRVVHRSLLQEWLVSATPFSARAPMNVY